MRPSPAATPPTISCTHSANETSAAATPTPPAASPAPPSRPSSGASSTSDDNDTLSEHLASRREVGDLLGAGAVPLTTLRAGIIIGHGGISWEMTRQLVEHLPAMVTPRWVHTRTQPIAVSDAVRYLVGVLDVPDTLGRDFDIGGPEVLAYLDMLRRVATIEGRRRVIVPVPLLNPALSSRWLSFVTDVDTATGRSLIDSMANEVVVCDDAIRDLVPFQPVSYDDAVRNALAERASVQHAAARPQRGDPAVPRSSRPLKRTRSANRPDGVET